MSQFEKITKIDGSFNGHESREKVFKIEKSDDDYQLVYRSPPPVEEMTPIQLEKYKKAKELTKNEKVIDIRGKNAKIESKSSERKSVKNNRKSH